MKSTDNLDLYKHSPERMAKVFREAAETALIDHHWRSSERQARHDRYMAKAAEYERAKSAAS